MKKVTPTLMVVIGVGLLVMGFTDYVPAGAGDFAGWSESCRYTMAVGRHAGRRWSTAAMT